MSFTTPLFLPLVKGLDTSKDAALGTDDLHTALNVDYTVDGQVRGRPARAAPAQFLVRDPAALSSGGVSYLSLQSLAASGFTPRGLFRMRDATGEAPALGCDGRLFVKSDSYWTDRGHFACTRVDRPFNFANDIANPFDSRVAMTLDFGRLRTLGSSKPEWGLLNLAGGLDREQIGTALSYGSPGNGARCGTTTAVLSRGGDGKLYFNYRVAGGTTITTVAVALDASSPADEGDAPSICCSHDATNFWVAYRCSAGVNDTYKVMHVSITGVVTATYTSASTTLLKGVWVDNTPVAGNRVIVGFTHTSGLTLRTFNATTLADLATDSTYATSAGVDGSDVVVGCQSSTLVWFCYRSESGGDGDLALGTATIGVASTATLVRNYRGSTTNNAAYITWAICHQPILVGGRMYITLAAATGGQTTATWVSVDLTNLWTGSGIGPFNTPTNVARGPSQATYPHLQPAAAVSLADGSGWAFPTVDWTAFSLTATVAGVGHSVPTTVGAMATCGMNVITFSGPKAAAAGSGTAISGSVPHYIAGGECKDLGFPFLAGIPGISAAEDTGGTIPVGSYSVQACWRWTDDSGQIHRGAPSDIVTVTLAGAARNILVLVTNPWLSEKSFDTYIEVYVTPVNPTEGALHYLASTTLASYTNAYTALTVTSVSSTTEAIYTDGSVLGNYAVRGDGGIAAMGRRLWMADERAVYASKHLTAGDAPEFNDEGTHQVPLPAGAGRVISIEPLDDKLVVFCERGVFFIQDGGPDRTGVGADFQTPVRVSDLAIAGPRSSCATDAGVVFCTSPDTVDASRGGPWLIDRQLTLTDRQYLGRPALDLFLGSGGWVPEVAFSPERQQVYLTTNIANGSSHGVVVLDMRAGKWAVWDTVSGTVGSLRSVVVVAGILWVLNTEPASFGGAPGTDSGGGAYAMVLKTAHMAGNGTSALGWGRIRGVRALQGRDSGAHTLTLTAIMDGTRTYTSGSYSLAAPSADTTWPATRQAPEWRLPSQKCATLQLQLSATPATARWSAIQLDVTPLPGTTPAKNRS